MDALKNDNKYIFKFVDVYGPINVVNLPNPMEPAKIYFWHVRTDFGE